jgi:hypothetical protein
LKEHFGKYGYNVVTNIVDDPEKLPARIRGFHNRDFIIDNSKSKKLLGMQYERDLKDCLVEMIYSAAK